MPPLAEHMKIVDVLQPGGPEALVMVDHVLPEIGPTEVLIEVAAAGVNRPDILQRRGHYPPPPGAPTYPGLEVAGTIVAIGAEVRTHAIGDRVCALLAGGGYAEYCAVDVAQVLPIPGALTMVEAASLPEAYFTVWSNVFGFGRLSRGESLLVHGGSSGIGVAAIQLASAFGSVVLTTAGSEDKCTFCERLGAQRAINYKNEDFVDEVLAQTKGRGVHVVLDMVGGSYLARNWQVLAIEGRLVVIATPGGTKGELDMSRMMHRRLTVTGSLLRPRSTTFKRKIKEELEREVWPLFVSRKLKPIVDQVFPLSDAAAAHAYMESGKHKGKIVLKVR
jgi:NADPH2:quinone reductase